MSDGVAVMHDVLALRIAPDVTAAARGDQQAFERLVDVTRNTVTSITLAILRDIELSRDVAQEVYLMVWRDLRKLRDPTSFLPWLRQLTRNRAHQALRTHVRRHRRIETAGDDILAAAADPRPDVLRALVADEERAALAAAIDDLPAASREVVVLYYREGQSAKQVAALLDLSEDAVKQRLSRARERLRAALVTQIEGSSPSVAFTAGIIAAVATMAAPATASAAIIGASKGGKIGTSVLAVTGASLFGALAGLAGGWAGVAFGTRDLLRLARDENERRGVLQTAALSMLVTLGFIVGIMVRPTPMVATVGFAVMMVAFFITHFVWLPRITRRRMEAELLEDPVGAATMHRTRRRQCVWGFAVGMLMGGGAVAASWFF